MGTFLPLQRRHGKNEKRPHYVGLASAGPWCLSAVVFVLDQLTKWLVRATMVPGEHHTLTPSFLHVSFVENTGAAFGLFKGQQWLFIGLSVAVLGWIGWAVARDRLGDRPLVWACALIFAGAFGNLIDRLRFGHVVDFIGVGIWPVFNVADSAITVGVALVLWRSLRAGHASR